MLAQTRLIDTLDSLLQTDLTGFVRLREPIDITSFLGWLKGQSLYPRVYWHARERDREFAGLGCLREIRDVAALAELNGRPKPAAGSWPRYYGGLAFDPLDQRQGNDHWREFGACRFILPRIELIRQGNQIELVCNLWLENELEQRREELAAARLALSQVAPEARLDRLPAIDFQRQDTPDRATWSALVDELTDHDHLAQLPKVVLARESRLATTQSVNPWDLLAAWQPRSQLCFHFAFAFSADSCLLASSPERLYRRHERELESEALAGTIIRTDDDAEDARLAAQLLADNKNRLENKRVHADILTRLDGLAEQASLSPARILKLRRLQHLRRDIQARLKPGVYDDQLLATLHPTPAVGGTPTPAAVDWLNRHGDQRAAWYTGGIGWADLNQQADVAVGLRCGLIEGNTITLQAGAGLVTGSDPAKEFEETEAKLGAMRQALTIALGATLGRTQDLPHEP